MKWQYFCSVAKMWVLQMWVSLSERHSVSFKTPFQWAHPPGPCPHRNCVSVHPYSPAQIPKSFPLTSLQSLKKTYGNIWFCMQIFTKKKWILFHSFQYEASSAEKLPAVHACWFGIRTAHSLERGMKPQTPFARGVNPFPRSRWEHTELAPAF